MDNSTIGALFIGALVTGAGKYLWTIVSRQGDSVDSRLVKLEERVVKLEAKARGVEQIGHNLNSFAKDLKEIHFIVTELRIELAARLGKLNG